MRTNRAFRRPGPADRFREWWYSQSRGARINKALYVAAALGAVAFINAANRDPSTSASGQPARLPQSTVTVTSLPTTVLPTTAAPTSTTTFPTSTTLGRRSVATTRVTTTVKPASTPSPTTTLGDPGVIFSEAPGTIFPPITIASTTTTVLRLTTTTAPAATTTTAAR